MLAILVERAPHFDCQKDPWFEEMGAGSFAPPQERAITRRALCGSPAALILAESHGLAAACSRGCGIAWSVSWLDGSMR
jgi:hypothetical protein